MTILKDYLDNLFIYQSVNTLFDESQLFHFLLFAHIKFFGH